jgi:hypothetical protein
MLLRESEGAWREWDGVVMSPLTLAEVEDAVERFLLRMVTVDGTTGCGDERGGVLVAVTGSLARADCTRASSRAI